MKFGLHLWLLAIAALLFGGGLLGESEEIIVLSLLVGGASVVTYIATLRARLAGEESSSAVEVRLQELERRLGLTEGELDVANEQLQRLRAERDFDRALAAGPGAPGSTGALNAPR